MMEAVSTWSGLGNEVILFSEPWLPLKHTDISCQCIVMSDDGLESVKMHWCNGWSPHYFALCHLLQYRQVLILFHSGHYFFLVLIITCRKSCQKFLGVLILIHTPQWTLHRTDVTNRWSPTSLWLCHTAQSLIPTLELFKIIPHLTCLPIVLFLLLLLSMLQR